MNISQKNIDELNAIISIELKKEDYLPKVEKGITAAKNNAAIKGFLNAHGHGPITKKMYVILSC
ncbi:MAG TPA: trigger factor [Chitinophagales bacterium]|nr:trigger factor [Chitinophagales bacterium]